MAPTVFPGNLREPTKQVVAYDKANPPAPTGGFLCPDLTATIADPASRVNSPAGSPDLRAIDMSGSLMVKYSRPATANLELNPVIIQAFRPGDALDPTKDWLPVVQPRGGNEGTVVQILIASGEDIAKGDFIGPQDGAYTGIEMTQGTAGCCAIALEAPGSLAADTLVWCLCHSGKSNATTTP